jgi:fluoride ion exporter CrcB/FEX
VGSFTTFSGITLDLATYSSPINVLLLILYPAVSIVTGLGLAWAGWLVGCKTRKISKKYT